MGGWGKPNGTFNISTAQGEAPRVHHEIHQLKRQDQERAYALVRLNNPDVDIDRWKAFMEAALETGGQRRPRGIVSATVGTEVLVGLYTWEVQPSLEHGSVFSVDNLIATGALNPEPLLNRMLEFIEEQAKEHECQAIQVSLPNMLSDQSSAGSIGSYPSGFSKKGFAVIDQKLCKRREEGARFGAYDENAPEEKPSDALR